MYHIRSRRAAHCSHSAAGTATAPYATHRPTDRAACCDRCLRCAASSIGPRRSFVALLLPDPADANPDHDSTLKFGVATSGWCISHTPQGGSRVWHIRDTTILCWSALSASLGLTAIRPTT